MAASHIPPEIQKNLIKSLAGLVTGVFEIPKTAVRSRTERMRAKTKAEVRFIDALGKEAAKRAAADPELVSRMIEYQAGRLFREQENREAIGRKAAKEVLAAPPAADCAASIEEDWMVAFSNLAGERSDPEMQSYFAKILANEVKRPGSFRLQTLDVAAKLTTGTALVFQAFCNSSSTTVLGTKLVASPFGGQPEANELEPLGLTFDHLMELQDAGLLLSSLNTIQPVTVPEAFTGDFELGGANFKGVMENAVPDRMQTRKHYCVFRSIWAAVPA